ncbi:MAG TPA: ATP-dependent DNA helicase RecQ [Burkholderiaceae bacterium]|nr:ATP-dependent DNA helicase RecQ [Burkholderiaceae bacterium]
MRAARHAATLKPAQRAELHRTLRRVFGLKRLRAGQEAVIANVLARRPTLAILPTGAGKSLCYQLPALALPGRTVIVSPLISLMKDQVDKLAQAGVHAVAVNSALSASDLADALRTVKENESDFVFTTPERLADPEFLELLKGHAVDLLVVDEAHCISQWGHDFRPAFLEVGAAHRALGSPPVLALTATANERVVEDIGRQLGVDLDVISTSVYRENLHFRVRPTTSEDERMARAVEHIRRTPGSGIVYTATVKAAEQLHAQLQAVGESSALYHGRLPSARRHDEQDAFMEGSCRVMVATNAFGLGIDKSDIRFVLHFQLPPGLDAYYQEAGRAGRDGEPADCTLIFFHQDRRLRQFLQAGRYPTVDDVLAVLAALRDSDRLHSPMTARQLANSVPVPLTKVQVALQLLKEGGVVRQNRRRELQLCAGGVDDDTVRTWADEYRDRDERDRAALERMVFYAQTGFCRWKVLLEHFGEGEGFDRCGRCDNCISPPLRRLTPPKRRLTTRPPPPRTPYRPGDYAQVQRYGLGRVIAANAGSVTLEFPDGTRRDFVPRFVRRAGK